MQVQSWVNHVPGKSTDRNVPSISPQDAERRLRKRGLAVAAIKCTLAYEYGKDADDGTTTPDPTDMSKSKREWEKSMMRWRAALERHSIVSV